MLVFPTIPLDNMVNVVKFRTLFVLFSNIILFIKAGIKKVCVRIANREDHDQTELGMHCLSRPF